MELNEYGRILWRRGWLIALVAAIGVGLAVLFAWLQPVVYRAEATLQVQPAVMSYSVVLTAKLLLQQFASQIETTRIAEEVFERVPLEGMTPRQLKEERIEVTTVPEDFLLRIDADFPDGPTAMRVADALSESFVAFHAQRQQVVDPLDRIEITVLSNARKYWQHWPRTRILAGAGGLLGLALGTLLALLLEYRGTAEIRSARDAEETAGLSVLGAIPATAAGPSSNPGPSAAARLGFVWRVGVDTAQLPDFVLTLGRRSWLILLFGLATAASAVIFGTTQPTIYRASAVLQVIPARYDFGLISAGQQLLRQFALQIEESPQRAQAVIDRLQLDIPIDRFQGYVTVASRTEEFLIQIDVDHPDPTTARDIADALAEDFAQYQAARNLERDRQVRIEVLVLEPAGEAEVFWPKLDLLAGAGAVLGLLAGLLFGFALEWLESSTLRSPREVERHLQLPTLGVIPGGAHSNPTSGRRGVP